MIYDIQVYVHNHGSFIIKDNFTFCNSHSFLNDISNANYQKSHIPFAGNTGSATPSPTASSGSSPASYGKLGPREYSDGVPSDM